MRRLLFILLGAAELWLLIGLLTDAAVEARPQQAPQAPHIPNHTWNWKDRITVICGGPVSLWEVVNS